MYAWIEGNHWTKQIGAPHRQHSWYTSIATLQGVPQGVRSECVRVGGGGLPRMICTAAVTGWAKLKMEWGRVLVCPQGTIPSRRVGWTGMNLARLRLTPALYWAWNRSPFRSSLKRPSPPTPTILMEMEGRNRGRQRREGTWTQSLHT